MIYQNMANRLASQINPPEGYYFKMLRVKKTGVSYIAFVHGDFKAKLELYDSWREMHSIKYAGPEEWADDLYNEIMETLRTIQINTYTSPTPLFKINHGDDIYETIKHRVITFNENYLKNDE